MSRAKARYPVGGNLVFGLRLGLAISGSIDYSRGMAKNRKRRPQTPKPRNEGWAKARVQHSNMNLTVPSGNVYKRKPKHGRYDD